MRRLLSAAAMLAATCAAAAPLEHRFARDPAQPVDAWYGARIAEYTTDPAFNTILTEYLPASPTVPTPAKALGDVSGAPNRLPRLDTVHGYFRTLAASSPRVKVFSIGRSEEGREMIVAAIADEAVLADMDANRERLAQLADPRRIGLDDARAAPLIEASVPVYYLTGAIHSTETGTPTSLMELAYRLTVDEAPYIQAIRKNMIVLITPVVEPDGWERMVDLYAWHRAHPDVTMPRLLYWGHYVAHDNNRDAMVASLALTRNIIDSYTQQHAQVLHDLHESVPFLYDNTVGAGPYNAWVDPLLVNEWNQLGWNNVETLTRLGLPGVFTHGNFDTWSPGYLMFVAAMHNGISRLYETFGNGGADTVERILDPEDYERTWYRPNPPRATVLWSQRNNNNYSQSGVLTALDYFSRNGKQFLHTFWLKSKRAVTKPQDAGPAGYVFSADDPRRNAQAKLLEVMRRQKAEIHRLDAPLTVSWPVASTPLSKGAADAEGDAKKAPRTRTFPAGSYVVRMDQPYSRIADTLLDRQFWAPDDPQKNPYDDTGWSMGDQFGVDVERVTDLALLQAPMRRVDGAVDASRTQGDGRVRLVANAATAELASLRFAAKGVAIDVATAAFEVDGRRFAPGTLVVPKSDAAFDATLARLGLDVQRAAAVPEVATRRLRLPRVAVMHTWIDTQTEGWWRLALDELGVPFTYISTQDAARDANLRKRFDVILFGPVRAPSSLIVDGLPMWGEPTPWKTTALTPNLGRIDSTDDTRPGLGASGVENLKRFVREGGVLVTSQGTAQFAIEVGLAPGVRVAPKRDLRINGTIVRAQPTESASPVTWGYDGLFPVYSADGMAFTLSWMVGGDRRDLVTAKTHERPTGRGGPDDIDMPQGAGYPAPHALADAEPWQAIPLNAEQQRNNLLLIPEALRPRALLRFADDKDLFVSGLLDNGGAMARRAAVVDARYGEGHVLLFGINPLWRGATLGSYPLVTNAILHFDAL
ncbi:M14 family zinc carboxypeptidase [Dokdonella sp. MW10]|uniref:M14 family zinc carboxypeptidase n=1 Tax=Dokdonella sp. MW10 TaxID=2992926 RepID=UPI003F8049BA